MPLWKTPGFPPEVRLPSTTNTIPVPEPRRLPGFQLHTKQYNNIGVLQTRHTMPVITRIHHARTIVTHFCVAVSHDFDDKDRTKFMGTTSSAVIDLPPKSRYLYAVPQEQVLVKFPILMILLQVYLVLRTLNGKSKSPSKTAKIAIKKMRPSRRSQLLMY